MFLQCRLYFCLTLLASPFDWHFWPCIFDQLSLFYLGITCPNTSCIYIQKRSGKEDTTAVFYVFFPWQQHALAIMKFQYTAKLVTPIQEEKVLYSSYFSGIQKCILCFLLLYSCSVVQRCQPRGSYSIEIYVALKKCVVVWERVGASTILCHLLPRFYF